MSDFDLQRRVRGRSEVNEPEEHRRFTAEQKLEILREGEQARGIEQPLGSYARRIEQIIREIRRRTRVVGAFPDVTQR